MKVKIKVSKVAPQFTFPLHPTNNNHTALFQEVISHLLALTKQELIPAQHWNPATGAINIYPAGAARQRRDPSQAPCQPPCTSNGTAEKSVSPEENLLTQVGRNVLPLNSFCSQGSWRQPFLPTGSYPFEGFFFFFANNKMTKYHRLFCAFL